VEDRDQCFRTDDFVGSHRPDHALGAMLYASLAGTIMREHLGLHAQSPLLWRMIQWPLIVLLLFSFASLYRFGPNL